MNAQGESDQSVMMIVQEINAIYGRWRAGEISQEDALFEIGDSLEKLGSFYGEATTASRTDEA
jgi:hypothetical protein